MDPGLPLGDAGPVWHSVGRPAGEGFSNWSGSLRFRPAQVIAPANEAELAAVLRRAAKAGRTVRPVGSAHSSTPLYATDDILVSLERFAGLEWDDATAARATLGAGTRVIDAGKALHAVGLSLVNLGDVATQTLAGVIGTGTHGSGRTLPNLSMMLRGGRMVTGGGDIVDFDLDHDPDFLRAARVSLGAAGIMTRVTLQLLPAFELRRMEWCTDYETVTGRLDDFAAANRNFDFYWYPRSDEIKLRCLNPPDRATDYSSFARLAEDRTGPPHEVIPKHSDIPARFDEMEFALPAAAGPPCFAAVRDRMRERWRKIVGWRVLYRYILADDTWLSPAEGRETVTISLHQNATLPSRAFFDDIEPIFRAHGGRPHWAKIHNLGAYELRPLYPMWDRFRAWRDRLDPGGVLLSPAMRRLLGEPGR